jgi:hypothetical protein
MPKAQGYKKSKILAFIERKVWVYLIHDYDTGLTKIGYAYDPHKRLATITRQEPLLPKPFNFKLLTAWLAPGRVERELHYYFSAKRVRGEWFSLTSDDLRELRSLMSEYREMLREDAEIEHEPAIDAANYIDAVQEGFC